MAESLNDEWEEFVRVNEAFYASDEAEDQDDDEAEDEDDEEGPFELTSQVTLRLPDGNETTGILCINFFDNTEDWHGPEGGGHVGIQLQLDTIDGEAYEEVFDGGSLIDIMSPGKGPWTRQQIEVAFNVNPNSPIWERE